MYPCGWFVWNPSTRLDEGLGPILYGCPTPNLVFLGKIVDFW